MIQLRLDRDTYAEHHNMIRWCLTNIGFSAYQSSDVNDDCPFSHSQAFGYLILTFNNEFDAFRFKMEWGGEKLELDKKIVDN